MWRMYLALFFSIIALATMVFQFLPRKGVRAANPVTYPLLAMVMIDLVALLSPAPISIFYQGAILLGLVIATLAVVFYYLPQIPHYIGSALLMIVAMLYFLAFSSANHIAIPSPILLLVLAYAALLYWYGREEAREQRGAFITYIVVMALMVWTASEVWVQHHTLWSVMAFSGAIFLVVNSTLMLVERVQRETLWLSIVQVFAYNAGQLLIAWSIWGFN